MYRDLYRPSSIIAVSGVCWSISIFSKQLSHVISEDVNLHLSGSSRSINFVVDFLMEYIKRFVCSVRGDSRMFENRGFSPLVKLLTAPLIDTGIQRYKVTRIFICQSH